MTDVESLLGRIAAKDQKLGAFELVLADQARETAYRLALERKLPGAVVGSLHGVPIALKDNIDMAGLPTTAGSRLYADRLPTQDATIVRQLRAAGMIIVGKVRMQELAFGSWGTNAIFGTPWNPWDPDLHRVPGGSSSGSAVAVAAGLVPMAIGTDTGGSVRIPAAICGLVGLKTTHGQIALDGIVPLAPSLDTVGTLATSVTDTGLLYTALAGQAAGQAGGQAGATSDSPVRIGLLPDAELADCDPAVLVALSRAVAMFRERGAEFQEISLGSTFSNLVARNGELMAAEGWRAHGDRITAHPDWMDPAVLKRYLRGRDVQPADHALVLSDRQAACAQVLSVLAGVDAVLTPTVPMPAIPVADVDEDVLPFNRFTRAVNYLDLCALSVPAGLSQPTAQRPALPIGLQLIGRPHTERRLLMLGQWVEDDYGRLGTAP
ncbi:MAG: amidase [Gammaproteobacteria bacterium]